MQLLLKQLYPDFNARNIERIMPHFDLAANWPNGMTGGREIGHDAIRQYWVEQWQVINSQVTPKAYCAGPDRIALRVHQVIKDLHNNLMSDSFVYHTYQFTDHKVSRMDISETAPQLDNSEWQEI
ncbi:MAG: nuclear transport factor 2 family protein [Pseudomonadota bacterium]